MNILIFGKDGQLGRAFQDQLQTAYESNSDVIRFVGRSDCNLADRRAIVDLLNSFNPQIIINAAAYTAVDEAEVESDLAFAINAIAPGLMARYAAQHGAILLHFSTDYVFDGSKQGPYTELDQTNPLSAYGKSKVAGEETILKEFENCSGRYLILRTSWIYGKGKNFIRSILRLAKESPELRIVDDQFGVPTSAQWIAELGLQLVIPPSGRQFMPGIYHAVPRGKTNWHGIAYLVVQSAIQAGDILLVSPERIKPIPSSEYSLPAPRPKNSCLSTQKLQIELERLGLVSKLPHWDTPWDSQVIAYVQQLLGSKKKVAE